MSGATEQEFGNLVGGRLCLDFVNTVRARVENPDREGERDLADRVVGERLVSYDALLRWGLLAGALEPGEEDALGQEARERPGDAAGVLERARTLREATYRVFKAVLEGWTPARDTVAALNHELAVARAHERLVVDGPFSWAWDPAGPALDRILWPVARSAAELLTSPEVERVGQCPGDECGWLFLDTSRSGRRRWCDMADCGNRAKVRRFRRRRRSG